MAGVYVPAAAVGVPDRTPALDRDKPPGRDAEAPRAYVTGVVAPSTDEAMLVAVMARFRRTLIVFSRATHWAMGPDRTGTKKRRLRFGWPVASAMISWTWNRVAVPAGGDVDPLPDAVTVTHESAVLAMAKDQLARVPEYPDG